MSAELVQSLRDVVNVKVCVSFLSGFRCTQLAVEHDRLVKRLVVNLGLISIHPL